METYWVLVFTYQNRVSVVYYDWLKKNESLRRREGRKEKQKVHFFFNMEFSKTFHFSDD